MTAEAEKSSAKLDRATAITGVVLLKMLGFLFFFAWKICFPLNFFHYAENETSLPLISADPRKSGRPVSI